MPLWWTQPTLDRPAGPRLVPPAPRRLERAVVPARFVDWLLVLAVGAVLGAVVAWWWLLGGSLVP